MFSPIGLPEQLLDECGFFHSMMCCDIHKYCVERAEFDRRMVRQGDRVRCWRGTAQTNMAAALAGGLIAEFAQRLDQRCRVDIAWQFHAASTSSRTKCSRITFGPSPSSKWQRTASRTLPRNSSRVSASVKMLCPSARAVYPPSSASSIWKMSSFIRSPRSRAPSYFNADFSWVMNIHLHYGFVGPRAQHSDTRSGAGRWLPGARCRHQERVMRVGNGEWGIGKRKSSGAQASTIPYSPFPIPVSKGDF